MKKELVNKTEIKLIGLMAKTNTKNEMDTKTAQIAPLIDRFVRDNVVNQIPNRKNPGTTFCVYTEYASDEQGDYLYFIGEEVSAFEDMPITLHKLTIPAAKYQKFTTSTGKMPEVVIHAWQAIWAMSANDFEGQRAYIADFEIYDQRAIDPNNTSLDIYIGIK